MAYKIMADIAKIMKCISSSQTPEQMQSCGRLVNFLIIKYKNYPIKFRSGIILPYVRNMNSLIEQKSNIWT